MTQEWSRTYFKVMFILGTTSKVNVGVQKVISDISENLNFQFSSKTHIWVHKFGDPSCRICSYGPYGPFRFSLFFDFDL